MVNESDIQLFLQDNYSTLVEASADKEWAQKVESTAVTFDEWLGTLKQEELAGQVNIWNTPSDWAETYLCHPDDTSKPLKLKDFQKTVVNDWYPNVAVRIGRQQGKCNCGNDLVHLADGTLERVEDLFNKGEQFDIVGMDARFNQVVRKAVVHDNGVKPCVKVKLRGGLHTEVTTNHRLLTISKTTGLPTSVFAEDLQPGDYVAVPDQQLTNSSECFYTDAEVKLISYYTAEGSLTGHNLGFTNFDPIIISDFLSACSNYGEYKDRVDASNRAHYISYPTLPNNPIMDLMCKAGLAGKHSRDKQCPTALMQSSPAQKALYLSCLIDCDGWIGNDKAGQGIGITLVSKRLIYDIRTLFLQLGIHGNITFSKKKCYNTGAVSDAWTYFIAEKQEILKAAAVLHLQLKADKLATVVEKLDSIKTNNNQNVLPPQLQEYCKRYKYSQPKGRQLSDLPFRVFKNNNAPQKNKIKALGAIYEDQYLQDIASAPIRWKTVESVEFIGEQQTYAIEILGDLPDELRYLIVDGIWQHNSVVLCIRAVWYCMRYAHKTFLIATPTRAQVWRLFEVLTNTASNLVDQGQVHITRGNPMIVRFANGSKIVGFTVGTKSGRKAFGVRGQAADILAMDEVDHMGEGDVGTLLGIKFGKKQNMHIWMSSTPTGERKQFYTVCTKPVENGFHAYHFIPQTMSDFDPQTDNLLRSLMTAEEYEHEVLAEFGAIASGVFNPDLIEAALTSAEPPFIDGTTVTEATAKYLPVRADCSYTIAADWNTTTVGQCITVIEWDPTKRKAKVWLQEETPNKEFSHTAAVERIVFLLKLTGAAHICVDYGFGDADIELLRLKDKADPSLNIKDKLIIINFGIDLEVEDPLNGDLIKKDTKPFVINTVVKLLEDKLLELPMIWDRQNRLVEDMRNFMVMRRSEAGAPVYTRLNDHRIISFSLGVFAVALKGNLLLPGKSGALAKVILRQNELWSLMLDKHPSQQRVKAIERTTYFKHSSVVNKHFDEEKYDENALWKLKRGQQIRPVGLRQTGQRAAGVKSALIPGRTTGPKSRRGF